MHYMKLILQYGKFPCCNSHFRAVTVRMGAVRNNVFLPPCSWDSNHALIKLILQTLGELLSLPPSVPLAGRGGGGGG